MSVACNNMLFFNTLSRLPDFRGIVYEYTCFKLINIDCNIRIEGNVIFQAAVVGLTGRYLRTNPCLQAVNQGALKY